MSADEIAELRKQLAGKDDILNTMKIKTKEFVQKLKDDHAAALAAAEQSLAAATQVMLCVFLLVSDLVFYSNCKRRSLD